MNNEKQWYTGEVITADELNRLEGRVTQVIEKTYRPNLLINSDFRNPINQRGQTKYSGKNIYTIDRWRMYNGTLDVLDGYIKFTNNGDDYTTLTQVLENTLPENDYVLSFKIKSVTGTIEVYANINNAGVLVGTISKNTSEFVFNFNSLTLNMIWISLPIGASIELEYIKLEQGSIATPLVPRPYAEELALCQRYYLIMVKTSMIITRQRFDSNISYYSGFVLPNEVRTVGTATYESRTPDGIVLTGKLQAVIDRGCVNYFNIWGDYPNVEITKFVIDAEIY